MVESFACFMNRGCMYICIYNVYIQIYHILQQYICNVYVWLSYIKCMCLSNASSSTSREKMHAWYHTCICDRSIHSLQLSPRRKWILTHKENCCCCCRHTLFVFFSVSLPLSPCGPPARRCISYLPTNLPPQAISHCQEASAANSWWWHPDNWPKMQNGCFASVLFCFCFFVFYEWNEFTNMSELFLA